MRVFISYSSKYRDICDRLQLALEADGRHEVFVDRSELTPGQPFDTTLREAIQKCDLLLFLLSPESVAPGSYALAELSMAKQRWRHPGHHVLPVKVAPVPKEAIPAYLRAVTILEPQGDLVAETVAAVEAVQVPGGNTRLWVLAGFVLLSALGTAGYMHMKGQREAEALSAERQRTEQAQADERQRADAAERTERKEAAQVATLLAAANQLCNSGDHALGWQRFDEALAPHADKPPVRQAREDCAMHWLRNIHVTAGKETFTDIVNRVLPVLVQGAVSSSGQRAADLLAHRGWADYLRIREGAIQLDPAAHYREALAAEAGNVFAHAMWGHHTMAQREPLGQAVQHFNAALASGRERAYVRSMQFAALLYHHEPPALAEAARVANDMRKAGETIAPDMRNRLWTNVYYDGLLTGDRRGAFIASLAGMPGAQAAGPAEHAETFQWLFPQAQVRDDRQRLWRYFMASLTEVAGDRAGARQRFDALRDELKCPQSPGSICDQTMAALRRLNKP